MHSQLIRNNGASSAIKIENNGSHQCEMHHTVSAQRVLRSVARFDQVLYKNRSRKVNQPRRKQENRRQHVETN